MSLPFANPSGRMMRGVVACYISLPHACRPFRESLPSALACRKSFPKRFGLCVLRVRLVTGGCCAGAAQRPSSSQQDRRVEGHLRIISWRLPRLIRAEQSSRTIPVGNKVARATIMRQKGAGWSRGRWFRCRARLDTCTHCTRHAVFSRMSMHT